MRRIVDTTHFTCVRTAKRVRDRGDARQVIKLTLGHVADLCSGSTSFSSRLHSRRSSVARDQSVRNRIVGYLAEQGAVEDSSGKATSVLKKAIGYEGTDAGFTQVVAAMAKAGLLTRQIRGKRTYRISNSGKSEVPGTLAAVGPTSDGTAGLRRAGRGVARAGHRALPPLPPTPRNPHRGRADVWNNSKRATPRCSETWHVPMPKPRPWRPNETSCRTSSKRPSTIFHFSPTDSKSLAAPNRAGRPNDSGPTSSRCSTSFVIAVRRGPRPRPQNGRSDRTFLSERGASGWRRGAPVPSRSE